jgi:FkbM family methyltransferase
MRRVQPLSVARAEYEKAVRLMHRGRVARVARHPGLLWSKALELLSRSSGTALQRTAHTFWGEPIHIVYPERVSVAISRYGFFEEELTRIFLEYVRPGMTVFDVGAHFGYYTLLASYLVGGEGRVHAFEPTPTTHAQLLLNVNARPQITVVNAAVTDESGRRPLSDYGVEFAAFNSLYGSRLTNSERLRVSAVNHDVATLTLDAYIAQTRAVPNFIKVDAEGAELAILRGLERTLTHTRPLLTLEVGDVGDAAAHTPSRMLIDHVLQRGYSCHEVRDNKVIEHVPRERYAYGNLLFIPR